MKSEFQGTFDDETIEHFLVDSYERLASKSKTKNFLSVLSEKFPRERLQAMTRTEAASPSRPGKSYIDWDLDDPEGMSIDRVRLVRDEIKSRVEQLIGGLTSR